jgi:hypothetical protein
MRNPVRLSSQVTLRLETYSRLRMRTNGSA